MAKKSTKATVKRIFEMAVAFAVGSVFIVPLAIYIKSKAGV